MGLSDTEINGVDFLGRDHPAREAWREFWPQTGNAQNWDGVKLLKGAGRRECVLVEAKANVGELQGTCGAKSESSLTLIRRWLDATKRNIGIDSQADWTKPYYRYAGRLSFLDFLGFHGILARLIFLYFCGDQNPGATCSGTAEEWRKQL